MLDGDRIWMAQGEKPCYLLLSQANRHGLIAGASGTGKTVTLKVMAEGFSQAGVPVFVADVKGDVTGMAEAGQMSDFIRKRCEDSFGLAPERVSFEGCPVRVWDPLGGEGIPVRVTVSQMGPMLLGRLLGLTDVQQGVLNIVFRVADDQGLLLIDLKDLRAMLGFVAEHRGEYTVTYGNVSTQSVGAIQRALIAVEDQGGDVFFGEPYLDLDDWFQCDPRGRGYVNILNAARIVQTPQVYAMFLLWMLSTLFETLPEVGDPDKPRFVFFFDEAHLLFDDMPKRLGDKIVQVVKLIRSKGVGVYFITQSPSDVPGEVLAQLSNRVQHGLRAYTPAEQKVVRAAAASFRANPSFDSAAALQEIGTGEALVSFLDEKGTPSVVESARVLFPQCKMDAADPEVLRGAVTAQSDLMGKYGTAIDRQSAFEDINGMKAEEAESQRLAAERVELERERAEFEKERAKVAEREEKERQKAAEKAERAQEREMERQRKELERQQRTLERQQERRDAQIRRTAGSILGAIGREASRQLVRGIFGTLRL
ncbi:MULTISPECIES: helicase HerA-like domain-containing protein [Atopobiaceae]|uniref:Helicase HerA-like C-terminal domain-containing protein n=1 Tax=Parafannyhessea umbonata TaxID=604330 RepID=A0A1H6HQV7_9ACTN|nr:MULTISPECIES: helicase HerA-like domain-containing protein [Atopobiaceae]SEH36500.1 hypothetical protein SAMN05216447_10171 [Parafannyhessea umbonata]SJZ38201.1 hypothetical protein SAMN06298223_0084 [Olsenella sp. KH1P3]